jgi:hypothetical protein
MSKTMTKYQLDHFRDKVKRQFNPMIVNKNYWLNNIRLKQLTNVESYLKKLAQINYQ